MAVIDTLRENAARLQREKRRETVKAMTLDQARAELSNAVYEATRLLEELEMAGKILGNGHHMRQQIAMLATEMLDARWVREYPPLIGVVQEGIYRHRKTQGRYKVLQCVVTMEATGQNAVAYQPVEGGTVWIRDYKEFCDGRFEYLGVGDEVAA